MGAADSPQHKTEIEPCDPLNDKEYLSIEELVERIPYRPQTIRNLMSQGVLREGTHYFKPTQRKVVFKWSAIRRWIEGGGRDEDQGIPLARGR
jgi:uncharacterized protein YheU (UPF0270 family)